MEAMASSTLSPHFHPFPPKPFAATPSPKASSFRRTHSPRPTKQALPEQNDAVAFPESLPLHSKNPHAVYRDIQRFARRNKLAQAFTILDYLDQRGIPVNATTFSALIAACVRTRSLDHAKQVHAFVRVNGLQDNEFLRTKLVHMYTSCGSLELAQELFGESPARSVYPWNALLRGSVIAGGRRFREAMWAYYEMRALGLELNVYSFSSVIKSFAGASALSQGLKAHALLVKNGLIGSDMLRTCLIDMYFKCGKVKLARRVFEELCERDVVLWGAMISGFSHNGMQLEALEYLRRMVCHGTRPNSVILTVILPTIGDVLARRLGREVHAYVVKTKSYSRQIFIQSALIDMYCKCGDLENGRRVFYRSNERNAICWTALMSGYVANGRLEQALRSIIWMQQEGTKPDVVTVATVLPVCAELRALKRGKEMHAYAVKNCFLPNVSIISSLMVMYSKCGIVDYSRRLFDMTEKRNVILWTAMIDSYVENGRLYEALGVIRSMVVSKHRPDSVAIGRMLSICSELKNVKLGKEVHVQVLKKNFESVHFVSSEVVKMYGSCGVVDRAKLVFDTIPVKGSMSWTAIIEAYRCNGMYRDAIDVFNKMRGTGFSPNHFTFQVVFSVCDEAGFIDEAHRIFHLMTHRYKIKASKEHYSLLIGLLMRFGREEEAQRFVKLSSLS